MTDRIPLIINSGTGQIQEIPAGDNLDLTGTDIVNGGNITANGLSTLGNIITTNGVYWSNGAPYSSGGGSYSDSNVVTLMSSFGSNTISTTGNVSTGNAAVTGLATVTGNITGGNISTGGALSVTGNATVAGTGSNLIRRAYGFVGFDTSVTLDNIEAFVSGVTSQLYIYLNSGSWSAVGFSETFQGGAASVSYWVNVPISSTGTPNGFAMSGSMNSQNQGCRLTFSDQNNLNKTFQVTVVRAGTLPANASNLWSITIERLV